jgi:hypothetical protein
VIRRPWTEREDDVLRTVYAKRGRDGRVRWEKVEPLLPGRSRSSITHRAMLLRADDRKTFGRRSDWTQAEIATLTREWSEVGHRTLLTKLPGRTWVAISRKAKDLGLASVPQGYVPMAEAARRAGYHWATLKRIIDWAEAQEKARIAAGGHPYDVDNLSVPTRQHTTTHNRLTAPAFRWLLVEWDACERAVERWVRLETIEAAARRTGVESWRLRRALVKCGEIEVKPRAGLTFHRLDPARVDQVVRTLTRAA